MSKVALIWHVKVGGNWRGWGCVVSATDSLVDNSSEWFQCG